MSLFYRFTCFWLRLTFYTLYRHKVYGIENIPNGPAIIAANHTSYYDPVILAASTKKELHFLARESLFRYPGFKWLIENLNAHPISGTASDLSSFKLVSQLLSKGDKVVIFPEGTRSPTGELSPIRKGIGMLALRNQVPIVPTYIQGAYEAWPIDQKFPKPWGKTRCTFGKPIDPSSYSHLDRKEAQEAIAEDVGKALKKLT